MGVYKRAYGVLIEDLGLFPDVRYNKMVERLHRYEDLLLDCPNLFRLEGLRVVDSKPLETKRLVRAGRHRKRGGPSLVKEGGNHRLQRVKRGFYVGYKAIYCTDGGYMGLLYVDPANRHD